MTKSTRAYVSMKDNFMSGWGRAEGRTNYLEIKCPSMAWAKKLALFVKTNRDEMSNVKFSRTARKGGKTQLISTGKFSDWARQVLRAGQA